MNMDRFKIVHLRKSNMCDILDRSEGLMRFYTVGDYSSGKKICDLLNELEDEKEFWKGSTCNYINSWNILSNEVDILQETKNIDRFVKYWLKYNKLRIDMDDNIKEDRFCLTDNFDADKFSPILDKYTGCELLITEIVQKLNDLNYERNSLASSFDWYQSKVANVLGNCKEHSVRNVDNQFMLKIIFKELGLEW